MTPVRRLPSTSATACCLTALACVSMTLRSPRTRSTGALPPQILKHCEREGWNIVVLCHLAGHDGMHVCFVLHHEHLHRQHRMAAAQGVNKRQQLC